MVRHPHFTQPVFLKFPRPAVMRGRDGVERFPQMSDSSLETSLLRTLRQLDPSIPLVWVQDLVALYDERAVEYINVRHEQAAAFMAAQMSL